MTIEDLEGQIARMVVTAWFARRLAAQGRFSAAEIDAMIADARAAVALLCEWPRPAQRAGFHG